MRFEYITDEAEGLSRKTYRFWLNGTTLVFDSVAYEKRPSRRHKFRIEKIWNRLSHNESNMERPQLPLSVKSDIYDQVCDAIRFDIE